MKKWILSGITAAMALVLAGCEDDREDQLEEQIEQLEQQVTTLEQQAESNEQQDNSTPSAGAGAATTDTSGNTSTGTSGDTLDTLTSAVEDVLTKINDATPAGSAPEKQDQFFELNSELNSMEQRLDDYENNIESQYRQGTISHETARQEERSLENLEDKLDAAEDQLEFKFGYDD